MKILKPCLLTIAVLTWAAVAFAQVKEVRSDTPKIIEVITEEDPSATDSGLEAILQLVKTHSNGLRWIAATITAGEDLNHTVAIFEHDDYASLQKSSEAIHAAWMGLPAMSRRPKLQSRVFQFASKQSYNDGLVLWKDAHAFTMYTVRLRTGATDEYSDQQRIAAEYLTKAKIPDEEWLGFAARYSPEVPAYLFLTPLRALDDLDKSVLHGDVLPEEVDRARGVALLKAVQSSSLSLLLIRPDLSSAGQ
jgi:hypothetical protein